MGKKGGATVHSAKEKALAKELEALIPELDAEGLSFLIEQARVHLYNMRAAALEAEAIALDRASPRSAKAARSASKAAAGDPGAKEEFRIEASSDGSSYDLVHQGKWKMFTSDEMLAMVRIASSKDPVAQVAGRLYRWLLVERSDVINDIPLAGLADPRLKKLVSLLKKTFAIKGR